MRRLDLFIILGLLLSLCSIPFLSEFSVAGQNPDVPQASETSREISFTMAFPAREFQFRTIEEYDLILLQDAGILSSVGEPVLPVKNISVAIPEGTEAYAVTARSLNSIELQHTRTVMPGQSPQLTSGHSQGLPTLPDAAIYNSDSLYPGKLAAIEGQSDLAGQEIAHIALFPLQYIPRRNKLVLHDLLEITVLCRIDERHERPDREQYNRFTDRQRRNYADELKSMVVNPGDVVLAPPEGDRETRLPSGEYDHVIITTLEYAFSFLPLMEWHTQKGVRDTVVTPRWICRTYEGPGDTLKIRQFIMDAASNWGTMYFLIGGEHETVPFAYRYYSVEETPSDQYYSDFDDDWTHEVYVGRVPVETTTQVETFVNKVLQYEKDPPLTEYPLNVLLMGFDLDEYTPCELMKETIDGYLPERFNVTKVYDSDDSDHYADANAALSAGQNLVNHADHCGDTVMGLGAVNHGWYLSKWDVSFLTNNERTSIVVSMGCWPNAMDQEDCIAETFVIYNPEQAGVAFNGNTRVGIYYIGSPYGLSCQLDQDWWRGIFQYDQRNLGKAINWSKHQFGIGGPDPLTKKHCEWTFSLLGEPEMPIWLDTPAELEVTHPSSIQQGPSEVTVLVEQDGIPVDGATVCLMKKGDVYEVGMTDETGEAEFIIYPTSQGILNVTVTAHDCLPYEGICRVQPLHRAVPSQL